MERYVLVDVLEILGDLPRFGLCRFVRYLKVASSVRRHVFGALID